MAPNDLTVPKTNRIRLERLRTRHQNFKKTKSLTRFVGINVEKTTVADKSGDILATKTTSNFGGRYSRILHELTVLLAMSAAASPRKVSPLKEATKNDSERPVTKTVLLRCVRCSKHCATTQND